YAEGLQVCYSPIHGLLVFTATLVSERPVSVVFFQPLFDAIRREGYIFGGGNTGRTEEAVPEGNCLKTSGAVESLAVPGGTGRAVGELAGAVCH
ncbi:MAG: hypothetical protein Q8P59_05380, partial [Dehalococcoidia bacterium]|nr:hypothetical protein [Dehalococcoidia bacterium]